MNIILRKFSKLFYLFKALFQDFQNLKKEQFDNFESLNLDYNSAKRKLDNIFNENKNISYDMKSEHLVLFSAISLKQNVKSILEIGTFDASNAFLMTKIFPGADIITLDLKSNDETFFKNYKRDQKDILHKHLMKRDNIIKDSNNINFYEMNSTLLTTQKNETKYDLIWIDGYHGNPTVTIDLVNSIRLIKKTGIILCDDIILKSNNSYDPYISDAAIKTLRHLEKNGMIKFNLFLKRLDKKNNYYLPEKKYIAFISILNNE